MLSLHLDTLVFVVEVVPVYSRQHTVSKVDYCIIPFVHTALYGNIDLCNMVKVSHPSIRPIMGKLGLHVGLIMLPSVLDRRKFSFAF